MANENEVEIKVTGKNTSGATLRTARGEVDDIGDAAKRAAPKVAELGAAAAATARAADKMGNEFDDAKRDAHELTAGLVTLKAAAKSAGDELDKTARKAGGGRRAPGVGGGAGGATTFTSLFQGGLINALQTPQGIAGAIGLSIPAGATIGGATVAGAGLGAAGAAVGGALAADPARVGDAWEHEIDRIKAKWIEAGRAGVEPTISAVHILGKEISSINFEKIVSKGAQYLEPLARAAGAAFRYIASGVETIVDSAGPEMAVLAREVPETGRAIKEALEAIADGSEGGADALTDLFHILQGVIVGTGNFIGGTEKLYGWLTKASDTTREWVDNINPLVGKIHELQTQGDGLVIAHKFRESADEASALTGELTDMTSQARILNDTFDRLFGIMMNVDEANIRVKLGMAELADAARDEGTSRDELTEKVLRQIQALEDQRQAQLNTGDSSQEATDRINANFRAQLEALKRMFPALAELIDKYEQLAQDRTATIRVNIIEHVTATNEGVLSTGDLRRRVGSAYAHGGVVGAVPGAAAGGVRNGLVNVAEHGRELALLAPGPAMLPPGSTVIPNGATENALRGGGSAGMQEIVLRVEGGSGDWLYEAMNEGLRIGKLKAFAKSGR